MKEKSYFWIGFDLVLGGLLAYNSVQLATEALRMVVVGDKETETKTDNE